MNLPAETPSSHLNNPAAEIIADLKLVSEVFKELNLKTAEIAEEIFDYLIDVLDANIIEGSIPEHPNPRVAAYIKILNRFI